MLDPITSDGRGPPFPHAPWVLTWRGAPSFGNLSSPSSIPFHSTSAACAASPAVKGGVATPSGHTIPASRQSQEIGHGLLLHLEVAGSYRRGCRATGWPPPSATSSRSGVRRGERRGAKPPPSNVHVIRETSTENRNIWNSPASEGLHLAVFTLHQSPRQGPS